MPVVVAAGGDTVVRIEAPVTGTWPSASQGARASALALSATLPNAPFRRAKSSSTVDLLGRAAKAPSAA
jgi:hypothetical protein